MFQSLNLEGMKTHILNITKLTHSRHIIPHRSLRKNCSYSEFFWSVFSRIQSRETPNTDTFHAVEANQLISSAYQLPSVQLMWALFLNGIICSLKIPQSQSLIHLSSGEFTKISFYPWHFENSTKLYTVVKKCIGTNITSPLLCV